MPLPNKLGTLQPVIYMECVVSREYEGGCR